MSARKTYAKRLPLATFHVNYLLDLGPAEIAHLLEFLEEQKRIIFARPARTHTHYSATLPYLEDMPPPRTNPTIRRTREEFRRSLQ